MSKASWQSAFRLFKNYPRVFKLIWNTNPFYTALDLCLTLFSAIVIPAQLWITKIMIDRVAAMVAASDRTVPIDWYEILTPVGVLGLVWALGTLCQRLSGEIKTLLSIQVRHRVEYLILQKAARLDIAFFEDSAFYDQLDIALREGHRTSGFVYRPMQMLGSLVGIGAMLGLLLQLHPLAVAILLLTAVPQALIGGYFANRFYSLSTDRAAARRVAAYFAELLSARDAVKEIRLFELDRPFLDRFDRFNREYFAAERKFHLSKEWANTALALLSILGTVAIWGYAIVQAIRTRITLGDVALVLQAAEQTRNRLNELCNQAGDLYDHNLYISTLFRFLDLPPDSVPGALTSTRATVSIARPIQRGIEFHNVSFRYPHSNREVLKNLTCTLHPDTTTALVGANGAGKTTLTKLIARFYDPTEGHILLDGKDLREYPLEELRRHMGITFQDFVRFDLTARENIGVGEIGAINDLDRIKTAAALSGAQSIVEKLPDRYDTMLGKRFPGGVDLSGGEWQKIALGRAFMRDAPILILDEPTAALDALAEYEIYRRFAELTAGKTTLFISHRFSTVRMASHILVIEEGALVEEGTHEELMAANGQYAEMFNSQAEKYQ